MENESLLLRWEESDDFQQGLRADLVMTVNMKTKEVKFFNNLCGGTFIAAVKTGVYFQVFNWMAQLKDGKVVQEGGGVAVGVVGVITHKPSGRLHSLVQE